MRLRDLAGVILLVITLQLVFGGILYGLIGVQHLTFSSIVGAVLLMVVVSISVAVVLYWLTTRYASERAIRTAMMTLSGDEQKVLRLVMERGEIRQDDLWRKLDMSRSKLSALVNNLKRKHAITKTRYWKTNILRVSEEFGGRC